MTNESKGLFSAEVGKDPSIGITAISLAYANPEQPSHTMVVSIAPELGSNMYRFRLGQHDIIFCDHERLRRGLFTGNFVLWPLPNRIRDKKYSYQGQTYSLEDVKRQEGNDVLIHGLVFDQPWQFNDPVINDDSVSVTTFITMTPQSPYYHNFPFESRFSLTYTLTRDGVTVTYHVQNSGDKPLPYGFALHPYFALLSGKQETFVRVPADYVMEADDELLPTGRVFDVRKVMYAMYDLRQPRPVGTLKLDHVYTGLQQGAPSIIEYRTLGIHLQLETSEDFTHAVIYTPPSDDPFFCLENQTCATDAINLHAHGQQDIAHLLEVSPGQSSSGFIRYRVLFRQD